MTDQLIPFPRRSIMPSIAIADEIERLIGILDEREARFVDCEPDADFEENGDAETETRPEWRPLKVVSLRSVQRSRH